MGPRSSSSGIRGIAQPGFERFRVFERSLDLTVYVFSDGAVGKLDANVTPEIPQLRMRPTPKIPASDPRIPGAVVGRFVFRYEQVGVNRVTGMRQHQRYADGNVSAAEVQGVKLDVVEDAVDGAVVYSLVYEVTVLHRDRLLVFYVDPTPRAWCAILGRPARSCRNAQGCFVMQRP